MFCDLVSEGHDIVAVSSPGSDLSELSQREGVRTVAVAMKRRMAPLSDLKSLWRLYRLFRSERPQIVHSITPKAGLLSMMAGRLAGVPVRVHQFTGLVFPTQKGFKRQLLRCTDALTCRCATHVLAEGQGVKNDLLGNRVTQKPVTILANGSLNGVDTDYYRSGIVDVLRKAVRLKNPGVLTFLFVGRMVGDKGVNELVEAFTRVNAINHDTRLVLAGEKEEALDPLKAETWNVIASHPAIEYVGFLTDVRPWMEAADVLVLPSYREGFPNVVLEAAAMGKPAIVTDINGANEIVVDGSTGWVVQPQSATALEQAMLQALQRRTELPVMGGKARERVEKLYATPVVRAALKRFYATLVPSPHS